ncbi:entry exclusion lipoprotein TrbK [Methylomonas sp. AM2-LC]|uniref:entry exclusion lipoprotein TrbK n=1 Tax=Methylomonas sp. AM2-LC TaxID=3153301 RepID=UPI003265EECD
MINNKFKYYILATLLVSLINGCSNDEATNTNIPKPNLTVMPEVNDENCQDGNIVKIEDKKIREDFAGLCIRRGSFKASPKIEWR